MQRKITFVPMNKGRVIMRGKIKEKLPTIEKLHACLIEHQGFHLQIQMNYAVKREDIIRLPMPFKEQLHENLSSLKSFIISLRL